MTGNIKYEFSASPWQHPSPGGWVFISLPKEHAEEIRKHLGWQEEGWGRLKVTAQIAKSTWTTAIWFDTKLNTYLLPLKAEIRKKEKIRPGECVEVILWI